MMLNLKFNVCENRISQALQSQANKILMQPSFFPASPAVTTKVSEIKWNKEANTLGIGVWG